MKPHAPRGNRGAATDRGRGKCGRRGTGGTSKQWSQSGLRDRPPRAFPPGTHMKPVIAARERELREMSRAMRNIGEGALAAYLTVIFLTNA